MRYPDTTGTGSSIFETVYPEPEAPHRTLNLEQLRSIEKILRKRYSSKIIKYQTLISKTGLLSVNIET